MNSPIGHPNILILYAHSGLPPSRVNHHLAQSTQTLPNVRLHDLYETYPDFHIDIAHEQAQLETAELIVLQFPVHWYSVPALLKEWFDTVLQYNWAYGPDGKALQGKDVWMVATTGGVAESYDASGAHSYPFDAFLPPLIQTMQLCGLRWLPPLVLHGAHHVDDAAVDAHRQRYIELLASYPNWAV